MLCFFIFSPQGQRTYRWSRVDAHLKGAFSSAYTVELYVINYKLNKSQTNIEEIGVKMYIRCRPTVSRLFSWVVVCSLTLLVGHLRLGNAIYLRGSDTSYARFPLWNACINASLSFELKTTDTSDEVMIVYTDDGGRFDFLQVCYGLNLSI